MESRVNYTIVGLFVVIFMFGLMFIGYWFSGGRHNKDYRTYEVYMREAVSGLSEQSPVKFSGVTVGFVKKIALNPNNPQEVRLLLSIETGTPVTTSTVATLMSQGVTGITFVGLKATSAHAPLLTATPGYSYPVIKAVPSLLVQLGDALRRVTTNMSDIVKTVSKVFDQQNMKAIKTSLTSIAKFSKTLADNSTRINKTLRSADKFLANSAKASQQFPEISTKLNATLTDVKRLTRQLSGAAKEVRLTLRDSRVAVQTLSQQALPSTVQLMSRLNVIATNLQQLSGELKRNPSMIIRGKQPATPGPGEK